MNYLIYYVMTQESSRLNSDGLLNLYRYQHWHVKYINVGFAPRYECIQLHIIAFNLQDSSPLVTINTSKQLQPWLLIQAPRKS